MAFGGQMHHDVWLKSLKDLSHLWQIGNVRPNEGKTGITGYRCQAFEVARIG
jgi:hypothetical protein